MLRTYLRPYLWLLGLSVLANVVVAGTTSALPWFIQQAIDKVLATRTGHVAVIPAGVVAISVVRGAATYGSNVIMGFVGSAPPICNAICSPIWCAGIWPASQTTFGRIYFHFHE